MYEKMTQQEYRYNLKSYVAECKERLENPLTAVLDFVKTKTDENDLELVVLLNSEGSIQDLLESLSIYITQLSEDKYSDGKDYIYYLDENGNPSRLEPHAYGSMVNSYNHMMGNMEIQIAEISQSLDDGGECIPREYDPKKVKEDPEVKKIYV
ncbi:MAG: hypothetical protein GQ477_01725 [Nanohaloarchaea archaeon]|nr:hypothetical protein [Candidatus Nanohaloarchaea archaeon]